MTARPVPNLSADLCGLNCPLPILRTKKALARLDSGQVLAVRTTDPHAGRDFQAFCQQTGNALLATGGTGDVLAGMVAAHWASMQNNVNSNAHRAACAGAYAHGAIADGWPAQRPLTAQALARTLARAC